MSVSETNPIYIDGSFGEGGGQIIRTSVALSALTGRPIEIANIRARRSKPGLQAQHLTSVRAAAALCGARLHGDTLGSQFLRMAPGSLDGPADFEIDVAAARGGASAGATGLVAQTMLIPMSFLAHEATTSRILGGTHVPMAPPADYLQAVYAPALGRMGMACQVDVRRLGYYPKGGGEIRLSVAGRLRTPICWVERGRLLRLRLIVATALLPDHVAVRGQEAALKELKGYGVPVETQVVRLESNGPGAAVLIAAECENGLGGWTGLGELGKPMERVAEEAVKGFKRWFATGAAVDEHLADQLALPCALMPEESQWTTPIVTDHLRTVLAVAKQFLPIEYSIQENADGSGQVTLQGAARSL